MADYKISKNAWVSEWLAHWKSVKKAPLIKEVSIDHHVMFERKWDFEFWEPVMTGFYIPVAHCFCISI